MKGLRIVSILLLVFGLLLGSVGSIFAQDPTPSGHPSPSPPVTGKRQGFFGNVTSVSSGNITLVTQEGWTVVLKLQDTTRYNLPGETQGWVNLSDFTTALGGSLNALVGSRVIALASDVTGSPPGPFAGNAVRVMAVPSRQQPLFAHRTGIVVQFEVGPSGNGTITIVDIAKVNHQFTIVGNETQYFPNGTKPSDIQVNNSFVTVVTTTNPRLQPVAKAVVLHGRIPPGWVSSSSAPTVTITAPKAGATLGVGSATVTVKVSNFNLVNKLGQANVAGEGHIHYFMDVDPPTAPGQPAFTAAGTYAATTSTSYTWLNVPAGTHKFSVELVNNDHTPLTPPVVASVTVTVSAAGY